MKIKPETNTEKRKRLIDDAINLSEEVDYYEYKLMRTLDKIKALNPTKKELDDGLQELIDMYVP